MKYNKEILLTKIGALLDPSRNKTFSDTQAIKHIGYDEETDTLVLLIEIGVKSKDYTTPLTREIAKIAKLDHGIAHLTIEYEQARPNVIGKKVKIIGVASGKGGVGKSTITANLGYALTSLGKKVGIVDADVYGANMPRIFDLADVEVAGTPDGKLYPVVKDSIELISAAFLMDDDQALMWRGPMLGKILKVFFEDTLWNPELDYLLIDLPPGTGDVIMDVKNFVPDAFLVIVTTPHISASHIAIKAGFGAKSLKQPILGVIENMAYFELDGVRHALFGQGGGDAVAKKLDVPLLMQLPIGQPQNGHHSIFKSTEPLGLLYLALARKLVEMTR